MGNGALGGLSTTFDSIAGSLSTILDSTGGILDTIAYFIGGALDGISDITEPKSFLESKVASVSPGSDSLLGRQLLSESFVVAGADGERD